MSRILHGWGWRGVGVRLLLALGWQAPVAAASGELNPLVLGAEWTYEIKGTGFDPACEPGVRAARVERLEVIGGREAFAVRSFCGQAEPGYFYQADGRTYTWLMGQWLLLLERPSDGLVWEYFGTYLKYQALSEVTVPAGTFAGCYKVRFLVVGTNGDSGFSVYCPDVGLVWFHLANPNGSGTDARLLRHHLPSRDPERPVP